MHLNVTVSPTVSELGQALANEVITGIRHARRDKRPFLLGIPAGRTLVPVVAALNVQLRSTPVPLDDVILVMMDDYLLRSGSGWELADASAHFSCRRFGEELRSGLTASVGGLPGIPDSHLWSPDPAEPEEYDRRIEEAGGIDLFFVAVGSSDGHVAFNPPGSVLDSWTRVIALAETTRQDNLATFPEFVSLDDVPTHGISVGLATIRSARRLEVLVHGAGKRRALTRLLAAGAFDPSWPATFVYEHPDVRVRADSSAAAPPDPNQHGSR